jgi:hypothetical protein
MCIAQILEENNAFKAEVVNLKRESPFYPQLLMKNKKGQELVISTLIRKSKDGIWYSIHLILRIQNPVGSGCAEVLLQKVMATAYNLILFYQITERDEICPIQISEEERLARPITPPKNIKSN